jgi:hypothetical protein
MPLTNVTAAAPTRTRRGRGLRQLVAGTAFVLLASLVGAPQATAAPVALGDPTVIPSWNALAVQTFLGDTTKAPQEAFLYRGFVEAAVYNAVVGIDGRYRPYRFHARSPRGASDQAAAVAAAHRVIVEYSPYATTSLDAAYAASLSVIPDGQAKTDGIAFGELAARTLINQRIGDGRNAPILFTQPPGPGVWRPTPPALLSMAVPWMGFVKPLLIDSGAQFGLPGPPPALGSPRYTRDFLEVKNLGSAGSATRTSEQTATALFFSGGAVQQYDAALADQVTVRDLDIVETARMFAAVDMTLADTEISVWRAKYVYGFWRPISAIQLAATDGNPKTIEDTNWTPLLTTPPYPDYVSGYSGITGAFTGALADVLRTRHLELTLISTAVPGVLRTYDSGRALRQDVISARVWLGIHFRFADTAGVAMGAQVADWALEHYFQPAEGDHDD